MTEDEYKQKHNRMTMDEFERSLADNSPMELLRMLGWCQSEFIKLVEERNSASRDERTRNALEEKVTEQCQRMGLLEGRLIRWLEETRIEEIGTCNEQFRKEYTNWCVERYKRDHENDTAEELLDGLIDSVKEAISASAGAQNYKFWVDRERCLRIHQQKEMWEKITEWNAARIREKLKRGEAAEDMCLHLAAAMGRETAEAAEARVVGYEEIAAMPLGTVLWEEFYNGEEMDQSGNGVQEQ